MRVCASLPLRSLTRPFLSYPALEQVRTRMRGVLKMQREVNRSNKDAFTQRKEAVHLAREMCDLVDEQQRLVRTYQEADRWECDDVPVESYLKEKEAGLVKALETKAAEMDDARGQKLKAQNYRESKLEELKISTTNAQQKQADLESRKKALETELESVKGHLAKQVCHIADLEEELKLVEESSSDVLAALTNTEAVLGVKQTMLKCTLAAVKRVQDFTARFSAKDGWRDAHKSCCSRLVNNDCHTAKQELLVASTERLNLCVEEGSKLLKRILFCENELDTIRERAVKMQSLGLMDSAESEADDTQSSDSSFSFVEEGIEKIQAQHDKAVILLETIVDDAQKTHAILDSEGLLSPANDKLSLLLKTLEDFAKFLKGKRHAAEIAQDAESAQSAQSGMPQENPSAASQEDAPSPSPSLSLSLEAESAPIVQGAGEEAEAEVELEGGGVGSAGDAPGDAGEDPAPPPADLPPEADAQQPVASEEGAASAGGAHAPEEENEEIALT